MKKLKIVFVLIMLSGMVHCVSAQTETSDIFDETDAFLSEYVENGDVAYSDIGQSPASLNELVGMIADINLDNLSAAEKKAFYINAYNILTIYAIIENDIPASPMDVNGFFDSITHEVSGRELTLDEIEKGILYEQFPDARLHFALVCAAQGCPPLQPFAYQSQELDNQLDIAAREALNNPDFIRLDMDTDRVGISQIFEWYEQDFVQEAGSVRAYINQFRDRNLPPDYPLETYEYDWSLNSK